MYHEVAWPRSACLAKMVIAWLGASTFTKLKLKPFGRFTDFDFLNMGVIGVELLKVYNPLLMLIKFYYIC